VQCTLFNQDGHAIPGGTITVDASTLVTVGVINFTWRVNGGRLTANFPFPDPNPSQNPSAFVPLREGPANRGYLLLSDDHVLAEVDPGFVAWGAFRGVDRLITKCQYFVEFDSFGVPHPLSPFCTNCVYIFVGS
jgi:hypothetical protein